jgi:hypothetical protein
MVEDRLLSTINVLVRAPPLPPLPVVPPPPPRFASDAPMTTLIFTSPHVWCECMCVNVNVCLCDF